MIRVERLTDEKNEAFGCVVNWYSCWLGQKNGESPEEIRVTMAHSLNTVRLPQTFVAWSDGVPAGMYQLAVSDDLTVRPDLYPWLINVFVDGSFRGKGVLNAMMDTVPQFARDAKLSELYLYTEYQGLYEKYGWEFIGTERSFKEHSPLVRVYRLGLC